MANVTQEYILKVQAEGLKQVVKEVQGLRADLAGVSGTTDKAAKGMTAVGKSAGEADRNIKGAAKATNNGTKAFSKMAQGMSGTLVPAYATVAANVFALTAAFGALERAADTQILIKASEELAAQTGRSLIQLSNNMKEITGNAISMKEALTQASIAASAGFDNSTIEQLTQVARNASVALGRDMTDSLNRVFKGAIKAEPELLDELGIILRLAPATEKYAVSLGKAVKDLTTFEKQQAVVNEVLAQGQEKFGLLTEIDTNPYTQLSASFKDLITSALEFVNIGLVPIIELLTENVQILAGAFIVFGTSVAKSALPILQELGIAVSQDLTSAFSTLASQLESTEISKEFFEGIQDDVKDVQTAFEGTKDIVTSSLNALESELPEDFGKGIFKALESNALMTGTRIDASLTMVDDALKDLDATADKGTEAYIRRRAALVEVRAALGTYSLGLKQAANLDKDILKRNNIIIASYQNLQRTLSTLKLGAARGFVAGTSEGIFSLIKNLKDFNTQLDIVNIKGVLAGKTLKFLASTTFILGGALGSLVKAIPIIGQIVFAFGLLKEAYSFVAKFFRDQDAVERYSDALDKLQEASDEASKNSKKFQESLIGLTPSIANATRQLEHQRNVLIQLKDTREEYNRSLTAKGGFSTFENIFDTIDILGLGGVANLRESIQKDLETISAEGFEDVANKLRTAFGDLAEKEGPELLKFSRILAKSMEDLQISTEKNLDPYYKLRTAFDAFSKSTTDLNGELPKLTHLQETLFNLKDILKEITPENIGAVADELGKLSSYEAQVAGISEYREELIKTSSQLDTFSKQQAALSEQFTISKESVEGIDSRLHRYLVTIEEFSKGETSFSNANNALTNLLNNLKDDAAAQAAVTQYFGVAQALSYLAKIAEEAKQKMEELAQKATEAMERAANSMQTAVNATKQYNIEVNKLNLTNLYPKEQALDNLNRILALRDAEINKINKIIAGDEARRKAEEKDNNSRVVAQLDQKIEDSKNKIYTEQTKKLQDINKLLVKNAQDTAKGSAVLISNNTLLTRANLIIEDIITAQKLSTEEAAKFREEWQLSLQSVQEFADFDIKIGTTSEQTAASTRDLELIAESYELEANYLREFNSLVDDRIDKELFLKEAANSRALFNAQEALDRALEINDKDEIAEKSKLIVELNREAEQIPLTREALLNLYYEKALFGLKEQIKYKLKEAEVGRALTFVEKQRLDYQKEQDRLAKSGLGIEKQKELLKTFKDLQKLEFKIDFDSAKLEALPDVVGELNTIFAELRDRVSELEDPIDKLNAGFIAGIEISKQFGDENFEAFQQISMQAITFGKDLTNFLSGGFVDIEKSLTDTLTGVGAALRSAAGDNDKVAKAGAYIQGVGAIIKAWNSAPPPANIPAIAATVAGVNKLLSDIDAGSVSSDSGDAPAKYKESIGSQGLVGRDLQSNSLVDSVDQLVAVNTRLFSKERDLQIAIVKLGDSFDKVAGALFNFAGSFGTADLKNLFNFVPGSELNTGFFGDTTTTTDLVGAGIELGATIEFLGDSLGGSIDKARAFLIKQVTETSSGFLGIGGGTEVDIKKKFKNLPEDVAFQLGLALDETANVVTGLFAQLADSTNVSLESLFANAENVAIKALKIDLADKSAEEQSDAIAAFFSNLSNKVIREVVPSLRQFQKAGEELTDTLIRIVTEIEIINNSFRTIGETLEGFNFGDIGQDNAYEEYLASFEEARAAAITKLEDQVAQLNSFKEFTSAAEKLDFADQIEEIFKIEILDTQLGDRAFRRLINNLIADIETNITELESSVALALEEYVVTATATWQESLLDNFTDINEFQTLFEKFSQAIFSETELAEIALDNSIEVLSDGLTKLTTALTDTDYEYLLEGFDPANITKEALRTFYDQAKDLSLFTTTVSKTTGELVGDGADLLAILIQMGAAFIDVKDAAEEADTALADFERDIFRQIQAFGLIGKELELLQLSFDFEDTIARAEELGANLADVELLYGLKRLEIIKNYNQQIVDSLDTASQSLAESVEDVVSSFAGWDEVIAQSVKIDKLKTTLANSLKETQSSIDFSVFDDVLNIEGADEFINSFGEFLNISDEAPTNIEEQIALVEDLQQAILDRYNAEEQAVNSLTDLVLDIDEYLKDLVLSDISPLTNAERLAEAQNQFINNLQALESTDPEVVRKAAEDLLSSSDNVLELGSEFLGIGKEYQDLFEFVTRSLSEVSDKISEPSLSEDAVAITSLQQDTLDQLMVLDDVLDELRLQNQTALDDEIFALEETLVPHLDAITTKLQSLNDSTWDPMLQSLQLLALATIEANAANYTDPTQEYLVDLLQGLNTYEVGTPEVEFDQIAKIHRGEMILTPETSEQVRSGESIITNVNNVSNISNTVGTGSREEHLELMIALNTIAQILSTSQEDILDQTEIIASNTTKETPRVYASTKGIV